MLNHVRSWLVRGLFNIIHDTRRTIGFICAQVQESDFLGVDGHKMLILSINSAKNQRKINIKMENLVLS